MSPERRLRVDDVLDRALALAGAERQAYLDEVCADDPDLRREVGSLLAQEVRANTFLEKPVPVANEVFSDTIPSERDQQATRLCAIIKSLPASQRDEYLRNACRDDTSLLQAVLELFSFETIDAAPGLAEDQARPSIIGQTIGHYKIIREIGGWGNGPRLPRNPFGRFPEIRRPQAASCRRGFGRAHCSIPG
jgi:hypothetical protein